PSTPLRTRGGCSYSEISVCLAHSVGAPPSVRLGRAGNSGAAGGYSHPGRVPLQRISVCLAHSVGAPPSVRLGRADNDGAAGGHSHPGRVLLPDGVAGSIVGAPPPVRLGRAGNSGAAGGYSHPGRVLLPDGVAGSIVGAPPSVRLGRAGNFGAAGGYSHPGRVLLQRNIRLPCALRRSTAPGAIGTCRQLRRRRRVFAPGAGAPTANIRLPCALRRSTALGAIGACRQRRCRRWVFAPGAGAPTTEFARRSTALGAIGHAGNSAPPVGIRTRGGCSYGRGEWAEPLQDLEQFDVEDQGAVRRDAAGGAAAVGQIRGDVEAPFGTFLHQLQCFGPAGDNAAYRELGGLAALVGAVKYLTTDQGAFVVGTDGRAGSRSGAGAFADHL